MATDDTIIEISLDGRDYRIWFEDCTAVDASRVRRETGLSLRDVFGVTANGSPDLDSIAVVVWLSRVKSGEPNLTFEDVASQISYSAMVETPRPAEESSDPE